MKKERVSGFTLHRTESCHLQKLSHRPGMHLTTGMAWLSSSFLLCHRLEGIERAGSRVILGVHRDGQTSLDLASDSGWDAKGSLHILETPQDMDRQVAPVDQFSAAYEDHQDHMLASHQLAYKT